MLQIGNRPAPGDRKINLKHPKLTQRSQKMRAPNFEFVSQKQEIEYPK